MLKFNTHHFSLEAIDVQPGPSRTIHVQPGQLIKPTGSQAAQRPASVPRRPTLTTFHFTTLHFIHDAINIYILTTFHVYLERIAEKKILIYLVAKSTNLINKRRNQIRLGNIISQHEQIWHSGKTFAIFCPSLHCFDELNLTRFIPVHEM